MDFIRFVTWVRATESDDGGAGIVDALQPGDEQGCISESLLGRQVDQVLGGEIWQRSALTIEAMLESNNQGSEFLFFFPIVESSLACC